MKMNWKSSAFFSLAIFLLPFFCRAQDDTNSPPTLADLMATNDVVTNTVGTVLAKISPQLWAGMYEVTQSEYQKVMSNNPSEFKAEKNPVDSVSWSNAMAFCSTLTDKEKKQLPSGYAYSLPTEDQWVMLAGNALLSDAVMSLNGNRRTSTAEVGSLKPNGLGLFDTRGNVMEWCLDSQNPAYRVLRGGAWSTYLEPNSRIEFRWYAKPDEATNFFGFRVVLEPASQ